MSDKPGMRKLRTVTGEVRNEHYSLERGALPGWMHDRALLPRVPVDRLVKALRATARVS